MNTIDQRARNVAIAVTLIATTPQAAQSDEFTDADLARMKADRPDPDGSWSENKHRKHVATAQILLADLFCVVVAQFHCFLAIHRGRNTCPGRHSINKYQSSRFILRFINRNSIEAGRKSTVSALLRAAVWRGNGRPCRTPLQNHPTGDMSQGQQTAIEAQNCRLSRLLRA